MRCGGSHSGSSEARAVPDLRSCSSHSVPCRVGSAPRTTALSGSAGRSAPSSRAIDSAATAACCEATPPWRTGKLVPSPAP